MKTIIKFILLYSLVFITLSKKPQTYFRQYSYSSSNINGDESVEENDYEKSDDLFNEFHHNLRKQGKNPTHQMMKYDTNNEQYRQILSDIPKELNQTLSGEDEVNAWDEMRTTSPFFWFGKRGLAKHKSKVSENDNKPIPFEEELDDDEDLFGFDRFLKKKEKQLLKKAKQQNKRNKEEKADLPQKVETPKSSSNGDSETKSKLNQNQLVNDQKESKKEEKKLDENNETKNSKKLDDKAIEAKSSQSKKDKQSKRKRKN